MRPERDIGDNGASNYRFAAVVSLLLMWNAESCKIVFFLGWRRLCRLRTFGSFRGEFCAFLALFLECLARVFLRLLMHFAVLCHCLISFSSKSSSASRRQRRCAACPN